MDISKSSYVSFIYCPKSLYLALTRPDLRLEGEASAKKRIADGKIVGEYAKKRFAPLIDVSLGIDSYDKKLQIERTNEELKKDKVTLAEASFRFANLYCAVDILIKDGDRLSIYEVKAATEAKEEYYYDTAFQCYVLRKCGLNVESVNLVLLNKHYIRQGELNLNSLFKAIRLDDTKEFASIYEAIPGVIASFDQEMEKAKTSSYIGNQCKGCPYFEECHKHLPSPNILDLNSLAKGHDYISKGIITYTDALAYKKWPRRKTVQMLSYIEGKDLIIDKKEVRDFLSKISFPAYHLDFETMQSPIPLFDGARPYQQIPFQYSLHIQDSPNGPTKHLGYLGRKYDCRREIAESLCRDIPTGVTSLAYNSQFEKTVLLDLANLYPDLAPHLLDIKEHMVDLLIPFKSGSYYRKEMGGSNSIKQVLPACCPNDPDLDYHALPVVHNGSEAMEIYPHLVEADKEEQDRLYEGLWAYCRLDTLAMVKVLDKLFVDSEE